MRSPRTPAALASLVLAACATAGPARTARFDVAEKPIAELQAAMANGEVTSRGLVEAYLARIAEVDPRLHAVVEVNPDAVAIADALDAERRAGKTRGPLHGVPVLVKDNLATGDSMTTTAGSLALEGVRAPRDATVVAKLRDAGVVVLGKTNLSEWANIRSEHSSSGWSARGGQTRNPYVLDRSPCGSSSGTGAAVSASLAAAGVGTETDGSIVCPSSVAALVGVKPTVGLVSRAGIVPISHTQDTAGPMARTVEDAALLLEAMAGPDPLDPATHGAAGRAGGVVAATGARRLDGVRIGVARAKIFGASRDADRVADAAIATLKSLGAEIVDPADVPHLGEYDAAELVVLLTELKVGLASWLRDWAPAAKVRTLADVVAWNDAHADRELRYFGQDLFLRAEATGGLADPAYLEALATCRRLARDEGLDATFARYRLDALLTPTVSPSWPIDLVNGDHVVTSSSTPAAVAGYPSITVPGGDALGLPIGVAFTGPAWSEAKLLSIAAAFEAATRHRKPPGYLPTLVTDGR
jgi:amidase